MAYLALWLQLDFNFLLNPMLYWTFYLGGGVRALCDKGLTAKANTLSLIL